MRALWRPAPLKLAVTDEGALLSLRWWPAWPRLALGLSALLMAVLLGLAIGPADIPLDAVARIIVSHLPGLDVAEGLPQAWQDIVWEVRLPRVLLAATVGATLALAGATYQGVFRNPLAEPYLIGVAAGAAL
ncbi:MAG TPA: iron chelate uptake ABC transporter family permease subunit, partial [Dehalococcoidia bacterium]|nr:iron chelate uptake ABC transporter family permease subunit [Dehalococcoidia bacterium]